MNKKILSLSILIFCLLYNYSFSFSYYFGPEVFTIDERLKTLRSWRVLSLADASINQIQIQIENGMVYNNFGYNGGACLLLPTSQLLGKDPDLYDLVRCGNEVFRVAKKGVSWQNNRAAEYGGVFYVQQLGVILSDASFINNEAGILGGAFLLDDGATVTFFIVDGMLVKGNKAKGKSNWLHLNDESGVSFNIEGSGVANIYDKFSDSPGVTNTISVTGKDGKGQMNIYVGSEIGNTDVDIDNCEVNLKDEDDRLYKEPSVLSHDTYLFHSLTVTSEAKLRAIGKPIEIRNNEDVTLQNSAIELGVFADRFKDKYSNGNSKYSSINADGKIEIDKDTKIRILPDKRRYEGEIKSIIMEGKEIEVEGTDIEKLLEFDKRCGSCKLVLEKDYENRNRDRIIARVKGNGLKTNLKGIRGLKQNEKRVAESLDKLSIMNSDKQYELDKLITILDTMDMKGEQLKVKEVFERNTGSFIANMVRSGGERGEKAVVYSRLDRKMKEDKSRVWTNLTKRNTKYEGNKIEERYNEKSSGVIIGYDHDILISTKAVDRARIGVYGEITKEEMMERDDRGKATNVGLGVYGDISKGKYDIRGVVEGGHGTYESVREIGEVAKEIEIKEYGNIGVGKATGKFGATHIGIDVEGGMNFNVLNRKFGLRLYVGIEGKINRYEGMKEEGVGVFALRTKEGIYNRVLGRVGVMVGQERPKYDWNVKLEYKRLMSSGEPEIQCALSNGYYFNTTGNREGLDKFGLGIGGRYKISSILGVALGAALEVSDNNRNIEGFVGLLYSFTSSSLSNFFHRTSPTVRSGRLISSEKKESCQSIEQAVTDATEDLPVIEFLFDATEITSDTLKNLYIIADKLKIYPDRRLVITGHTDSIGSEYYNENLSLRRALRISKFLRDIEIKCKMEVYGIGYREPIASNSTKQGMQRNRRVSVSIQPEQTAINLLNLTSGELRREN